MFNIEKFNVEDVITDKQPDFSDNDDDDNVVNDEKNRHELLVKEVVKKFGKKNDYDRHPQWKSDRIEVLSNIDEHGITKNQKSKLNVEELLTTADDDRQSKKSKEKLLRNFRKKKSLLQSVHKPIADRILRQINFKDLQESITKYDEIVKQIRNADQLVFPAEDRRLAINTSAQRKLLQPENSLESDVGDKTKSTMSSVEKEIVENLVDNDDTTQQSLHSFLNENELQLLRSLNMEEARKLHKEMQRLRVLISYQEAKYRRIRKIKSKKYHRIMRKDKLKKAVDEFDDLVAGNHEKAAEKLDELDRLRALERASLKHMNTGKWAKHHRIRAKYNEQSRNDLNEQLKISKEMMQKRTATTLIDDDGDDDSEESIAIDEQSNENESNKISLEMITQQPYNYCPWSSKLLQKQKNSTFIEQQQLVDDDNDDDVIENEQQQQQQQSSVTNNHKVERLIATLPKDVDKKINLQNSIDNNNRTLDNIENDIDDENEFNDNIDLAKFEQQSKQLQQVFGDDDDIVEQFFREKKQREEEEEKRSTQSTRSNYLPGWGSNKWSGYGIRETQKWKNKQTKQIRKIERKREEKICRAIFLDHEQQSQTAAKYKGYLTAKQSLHLNRPNGTNWNPETISKTLREPRIITRQGQIIEPMQPESIRTISNNHGGVGAGVDMNLSSGKKTSNKIQQKRRPLSKI
ncbi:u3 small nucleolar rna-associated protein 14-like protein [Dermatophagoides farinae]|uniref:U3 small nucleolar rna-associated protein 14-like protein n=1 Tax=Dermatophagoides farinae TaxID=6954 RepID=A0A9D4SKS6_DERFA|nr:U3 small nucleolar RNA-associated protein 14 homolog A-like [Dermatophagoides farinae]KAH7645051.1 u3 small nucleolar rna-associated protein 14-like protein [Dermatophagoides farinae]